ncbi:MAG: cytochrome c peroxidase [Burkholderiaceae bacterium]
MGRRTLLLLLPLLPGTLGGLLCAALIGGCSAPPATPDAYTLQARQQPDFPAMQALGRQLFFDPMLSASGRQSCASCHDPAHAYGPPNDLAVQLGGPDGRTPGLRAAPSLRYLQNLPPFTEHRFDEDVDESIDQGPAGGYNWDGRAASIHAQSALALLSMREMANGSAAALLPRLRAAPYAAQFRAVFGADALDEAGTALQWASLALESFQQDAAEFYPYSSKYDAVLRGQATLSAAEQRGLALFNGPAKGNCAACHPSSIGAGTGAFPAFTDHGFINIGVPRNRRLPANADPGFFDLGLCGPERRDLQDKPEYCGAFRTPSLRNVAQRHAFFHNGRFGTLEEVMRFYVTRDTAPQDWYARAADGALRRFDDLPDSLRGLPAMVNTDPPFDRQPGEPPALSEAEIADVIAFLKTLSDGYKR